jgi:1-acyl-sn-glycerol-3-phosphate acyltransferase
MQRVISLAIWIAIGLLTVLLWLGSLVTVALTGLWDPDRRITHRWAVGWARAVVKVNPFWKLTVQGREHLDADRSYVFVSNHQSFADVVLLPYLGLPYKCLSKSSLFHFPFFGWSLSLHRHIKLRRGSAHGIRRAMEEARRWLDRGMSVVFFSEGTRSRTGALGTFGGGAFKLAIQTGTPIVPVVINGTRDALPRGTWVFRHRVHGRMRILPPIETASLREQETEALKQRVFRAIEQIFKDYADSAETFPDQQS